MDWMTIITNLLPLVPATGGAGQATVLASLALELISRIKSQTGMTTEEIFERAGLTLEQNKLKLLADLERLNAAGGGGTGGTGGTGGGGGGNN